MTDYGPPSTCEDCEGTGFQDGELCSSCFGSGSTVFMGIHFHTIKKLLSLKETANDIEDKLDDILDKCNDIMEKLSE